VLKELNHGKHYVMYQLAVKICGNEVPLTFVYPCFDHAALLQRAQNLPAKPCEPTMDIDDSDLFMDDQPVLQPLPTERPALLLLLLRLYPTLQLHLLKRLTPMKTFATWIDYVEYRHATNFSTSFRNV